MEQYRQRSFIPGPEGLRAVACCGIIVTHVAFQTGNDTGGLWQRILARMDFFVPVFFSLSGFLLWRQAQVSEWKLYYLKRLGRILPAYWVLVFLVFLFFPVAQGIAWDNLISNFFLLQVYIPHSLMGGLTHLWSLSVEMTFYLLLPLFAFILFRWSTQTRIMLLILASVLSWGWSVLWETLLSYARQGDMPGLSWWESINPHILPPAFISWFAVGMIAAEIELLFRGSMSPKYKALLSRRWFFLLAAFIILVIAAEDGPEGLTHASSAEFSRRIILGMLFAACILMPYALGEPSPFLESKPMQILGQWSYGIFLWHMAILSLVFPLSGIPLFSGSVVHTVIVMILTFLLTLPVAALSYIWVEEPSRRAIRSWLKTQEARRRKDRGQKESEEVSHRRLRE